LHWKPFSFNLEQNSAHNVFGEIQGDYSLKIGLQNVEQVSILPLENDYYLKEMLMN
jgi:hypothetical protein